MIAKIRLPKEDSSLIDSSEYNNNKETQGIGLAAGENRIEIEIKIPHKGTINRARYMPQKTNVIATKSDSGDIYVFDYSTRSSQPG